MEKIQIEALISAPVQSVWLAYTQPSHIINWNFASPDWQCPWAKNDMRVGGKYEARMEARDGSFGFEFEAVYEAIDPQKSFSYTMPDGRNVQVSFEEMGEKTKIRIVFDPENQNLLDLQKNGWQSILDNFKAYTEALK
jgi:uncharacterized protein YndB with AHSA1/START domain